MRLRTYIWLGSIGLVMLTTGVVDWFGYSLSRQTQTRLAQNRFAMANEQCAAAIGKLLDEPPRRLLKELYYGARNGVVQVGDDKALGLELLGRLNGEPHLSSLHYVDAVTGRFVAAMRFTDGTVVLHVSVPGGKVDEKVVSSGLPPPEPALEKGYDARKRSWFEASVKTPGIQWSAPYFFADGHWGISASKAWTKKDGAPVSGVFSADFFLSELEKQLAQLSTEVGGITCVLTPKGELLFSPPGWKEKNRSDVEGLGKLVKERAEQDFPGGILELTLDGEKKLATLRKIETPSGFSAVVASVASESVIYRESNKAALTMAALNAIGLIAALLLGWWLANRVSRTLRLLSEDLARVGEFKIGPDMDLQSPVTEIRQITAAVKRMKAGLRSFQRYVPDDLVRRLLAGGGEAALGGETRRLTLMFSDIEGFTGYSESVSPARLVQELSAYFGVLAGKLRQGGGTLDKFIGDGLMVFFNAPEDLPSHEQRACEAVLTALTELERDQNLPGRPHFRTRIGLHAGDVLVGNFGTEDRFAYTVIGDAANVASRLESLNKVYRTQILASDQVKDHAGNGLEWRHLDRVAVVGRRGGMDIFELLGLRNETTGDRLKLRDAYEKALEIYFQRDFKTAAALFRELSGDAAAELMEKRCDILAAEDPGAEWTGVFAFEHK